MTWITEQWIKMKRRNVIPYSQKFTEVQNFRIKHYHLSIREDGI